MRAANLLLGRAVRHHDEAGLSAVLAVDCKGNPLETSRHVIADAPILAVFALGPANIWLEHRTVPGRSGNRAHRKPWRTAKPNCWRPTAYLTTTRYDALSRILRLRSFPADVEGQRQELRPVYNRAGSLDQVVLDGTQFVERIAYDAKGQRALVAYGNGVMTRSAYDPHTFRLTRLRTEHYNQNLRRHVPSRQRRGAGLRLPVRPAGQPAHHAGPRTRQRHPQQPWTLASVAGTRCWRNCWRAATPCCAASNTTRCTG